MAGVALLSRGYQLRAAGRRATPAAFPVSHRSVREYSASRPLLLMWFAYLFWNSSIGGLGNLSLYARQALGRDPKDFSGLMMALRFGCKSLGGYALGAIAIRRGLRTSALAAIAFIGAGVIWGWLVPGYAYLFAFGLMGAGELGGMYIPNCTLALSSLANGTRNLSLLTLATPVSGVAPAVHGALADRFGLRCELRVRTSYRDTRLPAHPANSETGDYEKIIIRRHTETARRAPAHARSGWRPGPVAVRC